MRLVILLDTILMYAYGRDDAPTVALRHALESVRYYYDRMPRLIDRGSTHPGYVREIARLRQAARDAVTAAMVAIGAIPLDDFPEPSRRSTMLLCLQILGDMLRHEALPDPQGGLQSGISWDEV